MLIRFIAHAGIAIQEEGYSVLIDPWFQDSTLEQPVIESLTGAKTIDFQLPKTGQKAANFKPDAVLISHFHPHHSPARDIKHFTQSKHPFTLAYPKTLDSQKVNEHFAGLDHVSLLPSVHGEVLKVGPFTITAREHTIKEHIAWSVKSRTGHMLHIADARLNSSFASNTLDSAWDTYEGQDFDLIFLTAGKSNVLYQKGTEKVILENCILTPVQGAQLVQKLAPKTVALIGIYNHSMWANWIEYRMSASECENEFQWALDWLAPKSKFVPMRPGHTFGIGDRELLGTVDTFIETRVATPSR